MLCETGKSSKSARANQGGPPDWLNISIVLIKLLFKRLPLEKEEERKRKKGKKGDKGNKDTSY